MGKKRHHKRRHFTAKTADKYALYQEAVQTPESEVSFIDHIYRRYNKRPAIILREDFCGTAAISCEWVRTDRDHQAIGVDIDPAPLAWSTKNYVSTLDEEQAARLTLVEESVLTHEGPAVDVICALNFSYSVFKARATLLDYVQRCHSALTAGGLLVMDTYGGPGAQQLEKDNNDRDGFEYVWHQARFNPITSEALNYIHFRFPDGSKLERAFSYDWRLWTLRELAELMEEVGFSETAVYWEDADEDGEGSGEFRERDVVDVEESWVSYIVGRV